MRGHEISIRRRPELWAGVLAAIALAVTKPRFGGDWVDYASDAAAAADGTAAISRLVEPGHLLWRPLGYLVTLFLRTLGVVDLGEEAIAALSALRMISALSYVACAALTATLLWRFSASFVVAMGGALFMCLASAPLNFAQIGTPYVPALAATLLAMAVGWRRDDPPSAKQSFVAGGALALSCLLWLPFLLAAPAVLAGMLRRLDRPSVRSTAIAALLFGTLCGVSYSIAASGIGLRGPGELVSWVRSSDHGIAGSPDIPKVIGGFARSVIFMGDDLRQVKRFLLGDPHNVVSFTDVLRLPSIWFLPVFYGSMAVLLLGIVRTASMRWLLPTSLLAGAPVLFFAVLWQGGDLERYLAMYPFLAIAITGIPALSSGAGRKARWILVPLSGLLVFNVAMYSRVLVDGRQGQILSRLDCVDDFASRSTLVVIPNWQDPLVNEFRTSPLHPRLRSIDYFVLVTPTSPEAPTWPSRFAARAIRALDDKATVWISSDLLLPAPPASIRWAEGEDPRLDWLAFPTFFGSLTLEDSCGEAAAFLELADSDLNRSNLTAHYTVR